MQPWREYMATVSLNLDISAKGLAGLVELSSQFNKNMQMGAAAVNQTGGTAGSRKLAAPASQAPAGYAAAKQENQGYNTQRAVAGSTGSATSDFARQASGLGGLVHVYATFAANMFAVSAGFNALSKAMDTSNLVKGLDQIGAASGRNLGSLAKQMVSVTNGAISLQQAMTSTAMASSGGMTNDAILRMTEVAKKASLALGRDMTDSMDRLTKGIVKTQPELLDELGIMTRVIPAQQAYAQQIGKTISSLTDFEKRQAFANAVLAEGEKKFGSINLDTNPYSKLLSSIQNVMQSGLELVNKVLGPLVNMLSASPTGLIVALGTIGAVLLKQAIPAIGMFREQARQAADEAHARVQRMVQIQQDAAADNDSVAGMLAEKAFQREKTTQDRIAGLQKSAFNKKILGTDVRDTLKVSAFDMTDEQVAKIRTKADELLAHDNEVYKKQGEKLSAHLTSIDKIRQESANKYQEAAEKNEAVDSKWYSHQEQLATQAKKLAQSAAKRDVLAGVADTAATLGPVTAFKQLREETSKLDMGKIGKGLTMFQGGLSIATSAIGTAVNAFGIWGQAIGVAAMAFSVLDGWMTTSAKEAEAFSISLDTLTSSIDSVARTLDVINNKSMADFLSVESTQAKANALNDLSSSISATISKFEKLQSAQGGWDRFFDGFWDMFGKGSGDKLAVGISNTVVSAFMAMEEGPAKDKARIAIQNIVGQKVDLTSFKAINDAIKDLDKTTIGQKGEQIAKQLAETAREAGNAASALTSFKTSLADIDKQSIVMSNALMPVDNFSKLGIELGKSAKALGEAIKDPMHSLQALRELAGDTRTLSLLPMDTAVQLGNSKKALDDLSESLGNLQKEELAANASLSKIATQEAELKKLLRGDNSANNRALTAKSAGLPSPDRMAEEKAIADIRLKAIKEEQEAKMKQLEGYNALAKVGFLELAKASYDNLAKGLVRAMSEASITSAKGMSDVLKQAGGSTGAIDAQLAQQSLQIQINNVTALYENSNKMVMLGLTLEKNTLTLKEASLRDLINKRGARGDSSLSTELTNVTEEMKSNAKAIEAMTAGDKGVLALKRATDSESQAALAKLGSLPNELFGKLSQIAGLMAQKGNEKLKGQIASEITEPADKSTKAREIRVSNLNAATAELDTAIKLNGAYSEILQRKKEANTESILTEKYAQDTQNVNTKVLIAQKLLSEYSKKKKLDQNDINIMQEAGLTVISQQSALEAVTNAKSSAFKEQAVQNTLTRLAGESANNKVIKDRVELERKEKLEIDNAKLNVRDAELTHLKTIGALSDDSYLDKKKELDLSSQENAYLNAKADISKKYNDDRQIILDARAAKLATESDQGPVDTSVQEAQLKALDDSYTRQLSAQNFLNEAKVKGITLTADTAMMLAKQADIMGGLVSITADLSAVFGTMGENIGKAAEVMLGFAQNSQTRLQAEKDLANNPKATEADRIALSKKNAKAEIADLASIASASKKLFAEKSAGYKILDTVEKASHLASMAMTLKETGTKISAWVTETAAKETAESAQTGATIAGTMARVGAYIADIYGKTIGQLGPIAGPVVATGLVAMMLAALGGEGGGSSAAPAAPTAEDSRKYQGTGMQWDQGAGSWQETNSGVFGDPSARNNTISKSIELMSGFAKPQFSLTSKMVQLLTNIDNSLSGATSLLTATGFNPKIGAPSTSGKTAGMFDSVPLIGGVLNNLLGMGGETVTTSTTGKGVSFANQSVKDSINNLIVTGFENYNTHYSGSSGFLGIGATASGDVANTKSFNIDAQFGKQIALTIKQFKELSVQLGETFGTATPQAIAALDELKNGLGSIDLLGMTLDEQSTLISAKLGQLGDSMVKSIVPKDLAAYSRSGETFATTVMRVASAIEVSKVYTDKLGISLINYNDIANKNAVDTTAQMVKESISRTEVSSGLRTLIDSFQGTAEEIATFYEQMVDLRISFKVLGISSNTVNSALIRGAGGADALMSSMNTFTSSFLSKSEQTAIKQAKMDAEFAKLGRSTPKTAAEFKNLVLSLRDGGDATSELLGRVLLLSQGMSELVNTTNNVSVYLDQTITILELLGRTEDALALKRQKELDAMDDLLKPNQKYIYA